ncbi:MAG: CarD family transcriptional regulator [Bacillota bacterium]|nr:CarD family transcriptional regulator [Bacillota bacterium]
MYQKGEYVIYGNNGICRIEEIGVPVGTPMARSGKDYYRLVPVFGSGSIYAPLDTKVFMRPILTKVQAEALIEQIPQIPEADVEGKDIRALSEQYKGCLDSHRCEELVKLVKTVYQKEKRMMESGKKLAKTEQDFAKQAKELLHREFSLALEMPCEEVEGYILEKMEALAQ